MRYNVKSVAAGVGECAPTQEIRERMKQDIRSIINSSVLPKLVGAHGACNCGGPGWRRAVYLNNIISDTTQTCPPAWELITTPRRSCARPAGAGDGTCYSAMFPTQGIQHSQICGRIIGYQVGEPQAFSYSERRTIDEQYVDGVSLTYGSPRQHLWTFSNTIDEAGAGNDINRCLCTDSSCPVTTCTVINFIGNDYFCETGVPPGQGFMNVFYADDPLWDG